jgi:hypothetical protein
LKEVPELGASSNFSNAALANSTCLPGRQARIYKSNLQKQHSWWHLNTTWFFSQIKNPHLFGMMSSHTTRSVSRTSKPFSNAAIKPEAEGTPLLGSANPNQNIKDVPFRNTTFEPTALQRNIQKIGHVKA